jgi:hypothetical protein
MAVTNPIDRLSASIEAALLIMYKELLWYETEKRNDTVTSLPPELYIAGIQALLDANYIDFEYEGDITVGVIYGTIYGYTLNTIKKNILIKKLIDGKAKLKDVIVPKINRMFFPTEGSWIFREGLRLTKHPIKYSIIEILYIDTKYKHKGHGNNLMRRFQNACGNEIIFLKTGTYCDYQYYDAIKWAKLVTIIKPTYKDFLYGYSNNNHTMDMLNTLYCEKIATANRRETM